MINDLVPKTKPIFSGVFDQNTGAQWVSDTLATFCDPCGIGPEKIKAINTGPKVGRGILVNSELDLKTKPMFLGVFVQNTGARWVSDTLATYCDPSGIGPEKIKAISAGPKAGRMD